MEETQIIPLRNRIKKLLEQDNLTELNNLLLETHPVDIKDACDDLSLENKVKLIRSLPNNLSSSVLVEFDEDQQAEILSKLSSKEISEEVINEIDSDDAADILYQLDDKKRSEVILQLEKEYPDYIEDIVDLMKYSEETAGGIMGKEYIQVNSNWNVISTVKEMRKQAEGLEEVYSVYVIDDNKKLLGTLGLKKLLTSSTNTQIKDLYKKEITFVAVSDKLESVANFFQRYDMFEAPVVDELGRLVGKITVDDVIDFMREESDKDYQLASGISTDIDVKDDLVSLVKARLPWLIIGVFGGLLGSIILESNVGEMNLVPMLILFVPLIAATAGNVGVQSSAIVVQALANGTIEGLSWKNLAKEISLGLVSGLVLSIIIFIFNLLFNRNQELYLMASITISAALFIIVLISATIGTIVPLLLHKKGIDPALATGPFVTTTNDLLGIIIYFILAKLILGI